MQNIFSLLRGKRCCHALFTTVLMCVNYDRALVMLIEEQGVKMGVYQFRGYNMVWYCMTNREPDGTSEDVRYLHHISENKHHLHLHSHWPDANQQLQATVTHR